MITSSSHAHSSIFAGVLMALAACPQDKTPGTTDDPQNEDTTTGTSTSTTTVTPTSSGSASTTTGETTAPSEPVTTSTSSASTSSSSTTPLDPDTTTLGPDTGGDLCSLDLTPALTLAFEQCDDSLVLLVTVHNVGTVDDAPAGVDVTFYEGTDATGIKLGTKPTTAPLPPGSSTALTWVVPAPPAGESRAYYVEVDPGPNGGSIVECDETNNSDLVGDAACPD